MPRILPSVLLCIFVMGCRHEKVVPPGPPMPAEGEIALRSMDEECTALKAALERWFACPNLEDDEKEVIDFYLERHENDFAAGAKVTMEEPAKKSIAVRCRKATDSVVAATERCSNGRRPKE